MELRYSITYMDSHSAGSGFRLFGFRRKTKTIKCGKCRVEKAIIKMSNNDDESDEIDLCVTCYNTFTAEQLLKGNPSTVEDEEEQEERELFY